MRNVYRNTTRFMFRPLDAQRNEYGFNDDDQYRGSKPGEENVNQVCRRV